VKQRAEKASGSLPKTKTSVSTPAGRLRCSVFDQPAVAFEWRQPAAHAVAGKGGQCRLVVDVEMRPGNEGCVRAAGSDVHRTEVVRFEQAAGDFADFVSQAPQRLEVAFRLEQRLRRNDDLLAGGAQVAHQPQPVGRANLLATRADHLADVEDVDRRILRHLGIEIEDFVLRPEVEQRSERQFHACSRTSATAGCRRRE
jgi:hypothetical protein